MQDREFEKLVEAAESGGLISRRHRSLTMYGEAWLEVKRGSEGARLRYVDPQEGMMLELGKHRIKAIKVIGLPDGDWEDSFLARKRRGKDGMQT